MAASDDEAFQAFQASATSLRGELRKSTAQRVTSNATKQSSRVLVQDWFRHIRPLLLREGMSEARFGTVDAAMQALLQLANTGQGRRTAYLRQTEAIVKEVGGLELDREMLLGAPAQAEPIGHGLTVIEQQILRVLGDLVPGAALSYQQAISDMADTQRLSLRGTANELRSVLWDVLDRLAPDPDVAAAPGFKLEKDRTKPTQKQKARYILKSRLGEGARKAPETTIDLIEERVGTLTRALYDRSSMSAHLLTASAEVHQLKMYVDTLLAELLEIHQH